MLDLCIQKNMFFDGANSFDGEIAVKQNVPGDDMKKTYIEKREYRRALWNAETQFSPDVPWVQKMRARTKRFVEVIYVHGARENIHVNR